MADATSCEDITVCVRLIRSFEYRNIKVLTMKNVNLEITVKSFMEQVNAEIQRSSLPPPFKKYAFDCMKINFQPHGAKTSDTAIVKEKEELVLSPEALLKDTGIRNETEVSYFKRTDYDAYKQNPQLLW